MRVIKAASIVYVIGIGLALSGIVPASRAVVQAAQSQNSQSPQKQGQDIFRFDTFGDEQFWTDVLQMQDPISTVSPKQALAVGLKVDVDALPADVRAALAANQIDLDDPAITRVLLKLNAVVGVKGQVDDNNQLTRIGVTCALCHSTVDNSFAPGIGKRLDGWQNSDLDVGKIVSLSNVLDQATKDEFVKWGPGKYDPRHHIFNGSAVVVLNEPSIPLLIPPIYGLKGVGFETATADGPISYWNAYVGISQMGGHGTFNDPRIGVSITQTPDLVTPKLPALLAYQLSLKAPTPDASTFDRQAANRGRELFRGEARCSTCHAQPNFTDVLSGPDKNVPLLHSPAEVGQDPSYALRTATGNYRTTPLRALVFHAPYFHDGSARDLLAVVNHYDTLFNLGLTDAQKADLVEYLKSL
jgi:hypothetical protein